MPRVPAEGRVASTRTNSILRNGDFEVRPAVLTAATNTANRWVDGTAAGSTAKLAYGWCAPSSGSGVGANGDIGFDTTVSRTGTGSLKLRCLTTSGAVIAASFKANPPTAASAFELYVLQPNTTYTFTIYGVTDNVATNAVFADVREFSSAFATLATNSTNKLSGTDASWRKMTVTFTTNASTAFGGIFVRNSVAGNVSTVWYDDATLTPPTTGRVLA
jgi:hypothetical protein